MTKEKALERVRSLSQKIDKGELSLNEWKWQRAEAMCDAQDAGATIREIAKEAGFKLDKDGKSSAAKMNMRVWRVYDEQGRGPRPEWAEAYAEERGIDWDEEQARIDRATTKKVLRNETQREQVLSELSEDEQIEVAGAALQPIVKKGESDRKDRNARRREHAAEGDAAHYEMVRLQLAKANDSIREAVFTTREAGFTEEHKERLIERLDETAGLIDTLRLAITGAEGVDWDAELVRLTEGGS